MNEEFELVSELIKHAETVIKNAETLPGLPLEDCGGIDEMEAVVKKLKALLGIVS